MHFSPLLVAFGIVEVVEVFVNANCSRLGDPDWRPTLVTRSQFQIESQLEFFLPPTKGNLVW